MTETPNRPSNTATGLGPGEYFDISSYHGNFRGIAFSVLVTFLLWHFDVIYAAVHHALGISYEIDHTKQSWAQLLAMLIGGVAVGAHVLALIMVFLRHRKRGSVE